MNPLAVCAWRRLPRPERPNGALGRHGRGLGDWRETPVLSTRQEMGGWSGQWCCGKPRWLCWGGGGAAGASAVGEDGPL